MKDLKFRLDQQPNRPARAIPLLGFIGGIWFSNVLDSVFNDNEEVAQHESQQDELLRSLNERQNWSTEAIVELARSQNYLVDKVNLLYLTNSEERRDAIRLSFALTKLHTQFNNKKTAIESLRFSLINSKKLNLQSLNTLLDTHMFENIDSDTTELISIDRDNDETIYFRFFGHIIDDTMQGYDIKTMAHWSNLTEGEASLLTYSGPPKVLVNLTTNCVLGIYDLQPDTLSQPCRIRNSRSSDLDLWMISRKGNPFDEILPTRVIEELPSVNIYCLGRNISIAQENPIDCPPYTFSLPSSTKWSTNDRIWTGYVKSTFNFTTNLPDDLIPSEISEPNNTRFAAIDALKKSITSQLSFRKNKVNCTP